MGNDGSKGAMVLACEAVSIPVGGEIKGNICFQINKKLKKPSKLLLVFSGFEYIEWDCGLLDSRKLKHKLKKGFKEIHSWPGSLPRGQYDFPFTFLLSDNLLPSFNLKEENYEACLNYYLHGVLISKDFKLKNSVNIEILGINSGQKVPVGIFKELSFKSCCSSHHVQVKGTLNSNIYYSNENLTFDLSYDTSRSSVSLKNLQVSLIRKLSMNGPGSSSKFIQKTLFSRLFPTIPSKTLSNKPITATFKLSKHAEALSKAGEISSKMIKCSYFLIIQQEIDTCWSQVLPSIEAQVLILSSQTFPEPGYPARPEDWNPQSFPRATMSFKDFSPSAPEFEEEKMIN
jgi:hypothetical protein